MKYIKHYKDKKTGKWKSTFVEEEGDLVFSTHTNVLREKLKKKKNENRISKNKK